MSNFDHIINWELKAGSHKFPGPNGGTCINEAAIVAAGFEYRRVNSAEDCPPCFSPVLATFAIDVNDMLDDDERKRLMPLVTRLAGSKDGEEWVERARAEFIMREIEREVFEVAHRYGDAFEARGDGDYRAMKRSLTEAFNLVARSPAEAISAYAMAMVYLTRIVLDVGGFRYGVPTETFTVDFDDSSAFSTIETRVFDKRAIWDAATVALTRAFRIGTQAPVADTAKVVERMEAEKARALERA